MTMILGQMTRPLWGNITTLNAIVLADPRRIETNLGFHAGRLSAGYEILLLKSLPVFDAFEFDGTTLRSGGREGLPAQNPEDDEKRLRVHDGILRERGADGYEDLQRSALKRAQVTGPQRLVRILPTTRHNNDLDIDVQYPMGGGFLQWRIKKPGIPFMYAAHVDGTGNVTTQSETFTLNSDRFSDDYDNRARFQRYLQGA